MFNTQLLSHKPTYRAQKRRLETALPELQPFSIGCSRDMRITGVSKHESVWMYHVEVLDSRPSLMQQAQYLGPYNADDANFCQVTPETTTSMPLVVRYSIMRRYNDFRDLFEKLKESHGSDLVDVLPIFPDGGLWSFLRSDNQQFLQHRKDQLQLFLRALDGHPDTKWCRALLQFLVPNKHDLCDNDPSSSRYDDVTMHRTPMKQSPTKVRGKGEGYVSLSSVKSPQIRFHKDRAEWKRECGAQRYDSWPGRQVKHHRKLTGSSSDLTHLLSQEAP